MRRAALAFLAAATAYAARTYTPRAWFPDGTALEIYTEAGGAPEIDPTGIIGIGPGDGRQDMVNRTVVDRENNILFAYIVEASRGTTPGTVMIRILPLSAAMETGMLNRAREKGAFTGAHIATVAAVREFHAVKIGEVVTLDVLYNPSTGVKVFEVLRPITDISPGTPGHMSVSEPPTRETISLRNIAIRVDGQPVSAPAAWMIGSVVRIDLPGLGAYVVSASEPQGHSFSAAAHADGNTLGWSIDGKYIEITSRTIILTQAMNAVLWVYHDRHSLPDAVRLQAADTVDWLLPKR